MSGVLAAAAGLVSALPWIGANLRPAALRGLPFYVQVSEDEPTRRWVSHEFPGRDDPWHEDLGKKTRSYSLEGLLIGADVVLQAKAFAAAADAPGPATLLHPWYGPVEVVVIECRIRHDVNEARVARIALKLERAGRRPAPQLSADGIGRVLSEADRLLTAAQSAYSELRAMVGAVDFVVAAVTGTVTGIAGAVQGALSGSGLLGSLLGTAGAALTALRGLGDSGIVSDTALPAALGATLREVSALSGGRAEIPTADPVVDPQPRAAFAALLALTDTPVPDAETSPATPSREQLAAATTAIGAMTAAMVAGELARTASAIPFVSRDEALAARDQVDNALAAAADRVADRGWDDAWRAISALRAASAEDIAARAAPLPRIRRLQLPTVLPATLVAYRLDGDSLADVFGRGAAIAERNRARHPGFLRADRTLEVLA